MKKTKTQKIRLGLFVIIGTMLFTAGVYFIGQRRDMFHKTFTISANFQNVNGLQKGNNVRYSGINIGTVKNITMVNDSTISVTMNIEEKIISHLKKDAIATIGSDGLVGNMIINIVPGKESMESVEDGDVIASYSKIGTDDILSTLSVTNENAALLTADLLKITNSLIEGKGTLGILLNDTIMAKDLQQSIKNLKIASNGASRSISELEGILKNLQTNDNTVLGVLMNDTISGQKVKDIVQNLENSSVSIEKMVDQMNTVVDDLNNSKGAYHYITQDATAVQSLQSTLQNINEGTEKFNENMEALKHHFLFRGYFKKLERQERKAAKKAKNN
ncbi:MlaD protein [Kordia sp. SMS9]|uniref:MlaD family protein n=1 Tax=Kordia sp. SMS9 TaxID=2282170 RepID=UPI000E0DAFD6|nr:MlaD family protein [Kordia sp. SMS9]AXG70762.1 MlaD protein [Kordia sp. SMS9]